MLDRIIELGKTLTPVRLGSLYNSLDIIEKPKIIRYQDYGAFNENADIVGSYVDFKIENKRYTAFFIPAIRTKDNIMSDNDNVVIVSVFSYSEGKQVYFLNEYYIKTHRRSFLEHDKSELINERYGEEI